MVFKALVILFLISILFSLFSGLYYLLKDHSDSERTVKSLTWRIGLSVALFAVLMIGAATGLIDPHGLRG